MLNDTKVLPVRFVGRRRTGARIEVLLVRPEGEMAVAFVRGRGRVKGGETLELEKEKIACRLERRLGRWGEWLVSFPGFPRPGDLFTRGRAPIPPYIAWARKEEAEPAFDLDRYQTVFAERPGSIAAPTAGLHFTARLLQQILDLGVGVVRVTLHVGPGTFLPLREEEVERHHLEPERYEVTEQAAARIRSAREGGGRVVAVGTTVARVLESLLDETGALAAGKGECGLFIHPPYRFRAVDALLTNFHLPESTLLMLVCAFVGREKCLELYRVAVAEKYRFFSYGDAMLILD